MCKWILILALSACSAQAAFTRLEALSLIESGNNDAAIGDAGEVSRYQILPEVWRRYTTSKAYQNPKLAAWVAAKYLAYLEENFRARAGREPTDFDRYVLWNGGPGYYGRIGYTVGRVHTTIRERARRYVNLRTLP